MYGGWHTLRTGEQPQLDFLSNYGPLSYWLRTAALFIAREEAIGEVVLCTAGYTISFALLFHLMSRISRNRGVAFALLILGLIAMPRFYKFLVVLAPVLSLWSAWRMLERPGTIRAAGLGSTAAVALLFRHDYGFAALLTSALALVLAGAPGGLAVRIRYSAVASASLLLVLGPWIAALAWNPGLGEHLRQLWESSAGVAGGMALPHPLLGPATTATFWMFAVFYTVPFATLVAAWSARSHGDAELGRCGVLLGISALVYLPQSAHRADIGHLLQVLTPSFAALAYVWRVANAHVDTRLRSFAAVVLGAAAVAVISVAVQGGWTTLHPMASTIATWRATAALPRHLDAGADHPAASRLVTAIRAITNCTTADERVAVFPYHQQLAYFARRLMPLPAFEFAPGYFDAPLRQANTIAGLEAARPALILWNESFAFDGDPLRNPMRTHARVFAWLLDAYRPLGDIGGFAFYARPDRAEELRHCLAGTRAGPRLLPPM
ncbi:MAG: hypothetical protein ABI920_06260 [Casimicrobiaceae bacterium]